MSDLKGHYGCNQNGEHERCGSLSCGVYDRCNVRNTMWFSEENKRITNANRIRAMSDEELASVIMCPYENFTGECSTECEDGRGNCIKCSLEWLQSEAKESETE